MPEPVYVTYFTDPLCSWCWAFEPSWRWLLSRFPGLLRYRYRMGGLLADWRRYRDPLNSINKPGQMAPLWMQVQRQTGQPLNPDLWHRNPPSSSYPASIAFKAAEMVRLDFAEFYLRRLREAAMLHARDISDKQVLVAVAEEACADCDENEAINLDDFLKALERPDAEAAFREDLKEVRFLEIGRFPTVIFHRPGTRGLALTGYRPFPALYEGLFRFAPDLVSPESEPKPLPIEEFAAYVARWQSVTVEELMENFALPRVRIQKELCSQESSAIKAGAGDEEIEQTFP